MEFPLFKSNKTCKRLVSGTVLAMAHKIVVALLLAECMGLLLAQDPEPERFKVMDIDLATFQNWYGRTTLFMFVITESKELAIYLVNQGKILFVNVLKDVELRIGNLANISQEELEPHTRVFIDYIEKVNNVPRKSHVESFLDMYALLGEFASIMGRYDFNGNSYPDDIYKNFDYLLKHNGAERWKKMFSDRFEQFIEKFSGRMDAYIAGLSETQREREAGMLEWYQQWQNLYDTLDKWESFNKNFFKFYQY